MSDLSERTLADRTGTVCLALLATLLVQAAGATPPGRSEPRAPEPARKVDVTDLYHGVRVTEHYRWLERGDDPEVRRWSAAQDAYARRILDGLPLSGALRARLREVMGSVTEGCTSVVYRPGLLFALRRQPPKSQPFLVVVPIRSEGTFTVADERVVFDPNSLYPAPAIDWYVPSNDGKLVAVSLSKSGTESGDVSIYEAAGGKKVFETIARVNGGTAGGDVCWAPDGKGFYYTRYPRKGERPEPELGFWMQVYYHALGTDEAQDRYELGRGFPRIAEIQLDADMETGRVLASVQNGDGGEFAHHLREPDGRWRQLSRFGDGIQEARFGPGDTLFVLSRRGAPKGRIHRVPIDTLDVASSLVLVPEGEDAVVEDFWGGNSIVPTASHLFLLYQLGGPSEVRMFDFDGKRLEGPKQLPVSDVVGLTRFGTTGVLFGNRSYVSPLQWMRFDARAGRTVSAALSTEQKLDFSDAEVLREMARSRDGTMIPVNVIRPKGAPRDGTAACVVTGYGGFGVASSPRLRPWLRVLLDHGVCHAVANLRGGGEYGAEWHAQGRLTKKQNVFDDFEAVLRLLLDRGYASSGRLGIMGGSNGGLLMGATLVQHPDLVRAVVSWVGIYDMLRVELSPNGSFNVTEYGTVRDPEQFRAMLAYSPYHNVKDGVAFPPTLLLTGGNDPRVDPMQSRKFAARLQAANGGSAPVLLRTDADGGHGLTTGLDAQVEEYTHVLAFLFHHLGVK